VRAVDERTFLRRPAGSLVVGPSWVYGALDERLHFSIVHGVATDGGALDGLMRLWSTEGRPGGPRLSLFDAGGLTTIPAPAFERVTRYLEDNRPSLARSLAKQALVCPPGLPGSIVAGYYRVSPPPYAVEVFAERGAALRWLGYAPDALAAVEPFIVEEPLVRALRERLAARGPRGATLAGFARALAVSERSLQRRLQAAGTSFQREVVRAQVERAMRLLLETDWKLAAIAADVGCGSLAGFSALFRREVGAPPSEWRAARRAGPRP
jgi:AraC-like DNA-binding protein